MLDFLSSTSFLVSQGATCLLLSYLLRLHTTKGHSYTEAVSASPSSDCTTIECKRSSISDFRRYCGWVGRRKVRPITPHMKTHRSAQPRS